MSLALFLGTATFALAKNDKNPTEVEATTYNQSINDYYSSINWNLTGANLKTALYDKIKITTAGWSYDGLWEAYKTTDVRPDGTHFWDIYSDTTMYTLNDSRINHSYKKEGDSINREHVIPQSSFNEAAPMKSDVHHVLPSDGYVNNRRSSYPHGEVTGSPTYTSNDGCKLGSGGGNLGIVFEPMDQYKGDIARIYFYFVTCYQNKMSSNTFTAFDKTTYPSISSKYLPTYLKWAKEDPVSQKEIDRNNAAYAGQGNRNPFIDCPYAVGAIWDTEHATDYGNKGEYTSGEGVSISRSSISMISGGTTTIHATSTNSSNITWLTSNSSVVSISSNSSSSGTDITLTAGTAGNATITARATISGNTYFKTCSVTVAATKQVSSIEVSNPKTSYAVDDTFVKPTVTASYNDGTDAVVTNDASFTGYNMSTAGAYTVTVSYTYGGVTKTTTYQITVTAAGGSTNIGDYTIASSPLLSAGISNGMKVVWGTSTSNLATNIESNWVYLSSNSDDWIVFTVEGTSSGFKLNSDDGYVYCSSEKKVAFSSSGTSFTLTAGGLVTNGSTGTFYYNTSGLRPYSSGSSNYSNAYLYALTPNKTLSEIDISTYPTKLTYEVGEYFNPTGLVISRTYDDNSSDTYTYAGHTTEFSFVPSLSTALTVDDDTVEVIYGGESCFFDITVNVPLVLSSINIEGYTTSFTEGDTFSYGGTVIANYGNGSIEDVTNKATYTGYDMTDLGSQTVTVSYGGKTKTYSITVNHGTLSSIAVNGQTTEYVKNGAFSFNGTCTATLANGYQKIVEPTSVSSPDMSTSGNKTITVSFSYYGVTKTTSYTITVSAYRTVMETTLSVLGTIDYTSGEEDISINTLSTSTSGYTVIENAPDSSNKAMRLGSGSKTGTLTIKSTTSNIYKVVVYVRAYNTDSNVNLTIGGSNNTITTSYSNYEKVYTTATNSVDISTTANSKRAWVNYVTIYTKTSQDIGQTDDCVGLENFISSYMHMDYNQNLGYCKDNTHHYYSSAKAAFNALNAHQRSLFTSNSAYVAEYARLAAWASFNNESLNNNNQFARTNNVKVLNVEYPSVYTLIAISFVVLTISAIGFVCFRKRKQK